MDATNFMNKIFYLLFICTLVSCGNDDEVYTYFGGQIVNPKHNYVVLYKNDNAFDSVKLDAHNRFSFRFDKLEGGIYKFSNQPEHQYIILEQGDSLLLRLNTMDFDESLVFSGKGAKKNNILIVIDPEIRIMTENGRELAPYDREDL